jgi:DNA-binding PucR family transcriptional regulator
MSDAAFREVAARVAAGFDQIVEDMLDRVWANPALARWTRPETRDIAKEIARGSIGRELAALERRELPTSCPEEDAAAAQAAVTYGAPVTVVLQNYRAGHAAIWRAWVDAVEETEPNVAARRELLDAGSDFLFDYVDRCSAWAEAEHSRERDRVLRTQEQRRVQVVRDVLDGVDTDSDALGYDLDGEHLGLIAWGREPDKALREAEEKLGGDLLAIDVDARTTWGWLRDVSPSARALEALRFEAGTALALGRPGQGLEGFRRTHQEARQARRVAALRPAPMTRYEDVALEALAGQDEERARAFVAAELGALAGNAKRDTLLRDTLTAYFAAGQNAASTAATLGVHERTISNRLRTAEERLGHSVPSRRAELETALRLHQLLSH